jgi:DNA-binding transcriptional MerR regulator
MFSIGDLSGRTGVKVTTIRYYEQQGLLPDPERTDGGQRRYDRDGLRRLAFIKHARDLGLKIGAIRDLIALSNRPDQSCADAHRIASAHLADIRDRIERLRRLEAELDRIARHNDSGVAADCCVLDALEDHGQCSDRH